MSAEFDSDPFTDALREDLPSARDEARVRARLASAGVLAGVGAVAPGATAAATTGTATAGVVTKVLALPLTAKLGGVALLACAVAVPVVRAHSHARTPVAVASKAVPARVNASSLTDAKRRATNLAGVPLAVATGDRASGPPLVTPPLETEAPVVAATPFAGATPAAASRVERMKSRGAGPVAVTTVNGASALSTAVSGASESSPAVGSFPVVAAPVDEGTLRAETTLMEQALGALKRGDLATAEQKLTQHARTFPDGPLAPERDRALARVREKETLR